jgi:hypothetical protein
MIALPRATARSARPQNKTQNKETKFRQWRINHKSEAIQSLQYHVVKKIHGKPGGNKFQTIPTVMSAAARKLHI